MRNIIVVFAILRTRLENGREFICPVTVHFACSLTDILGKCSGWDWRRWNRT